MTQEIRCQECGGCGYHIVSGCCGQYTRTGECCGQAIPEQARCERCSGGGLILIEDEAQK